MSRSSLWRGRQRALRSLGWHRRHPQDSTSELYHSENNKRGKNAAGMRARGRSWQPPDVGPRGLFERASLDLLMRRQFCAEIERRSRGDAGEISLRRVSRDWRWRTTGGETFDKCGKPRFELRNELS